MSENPSINVEKNGHVLELSLAFNSVTKNGYEVAFSASDTLLLIRPQIVTEEICHEMRDFISASLTEPLQNMFNIIAGGMTSDEVTEYIKTGVGPDNSPRIQEQLGVMMESFEAFYDGFETKYGYLFQQVYIDLNFKQKLGGPAP
jgi:hypothetical protein